MIAPVLASIDAVAATTPPAWAAAAGTLTAPAGSWLGGHVRTQSLIAAFAGLMRLIAARMWRKAADRIERSAAPRWPASSPSRSCSS